MTAIEEIFTEDSARAARFMLWAGKLAKAAIALLVLVLSHDGLVLLDLGDGVEGGLELHAAVVIAAHHAASLVQHLIAGLEVLGMHGGGVDVLDDLGAGGGVIVVDLGSDADAGHLGGVLLLAGTVDVVGGAGASQTDGHLGAVLGDSAEVLVGQAAGHDLQGGQLLMEDVAGQVDQTNEASDLIVAQYVAKNG